MSGLRGPLAAIPRDSTVTGQSPGITRPARFALKRALAVQSATGFIAEFLQGLKEAGYVEAGTLQLNTAGREINTIGCRRSQPISSAAG
jgi:hypothetical protein